MNLIVATDRKRGIGFENSLLFRIPEDMRFFREKTVGKVVVMGRRTYESLPKGGLPERVNAVLSRSAEDLENTRVFASIEELLKFLKAYDSDDIFVIGGGEVYALLAPYCKTAFVTEVDGEFKADKFFTAVDVSKGWTKIYTSETKRCGELSYRFCTYENNFLLPF